MKNAIYEKQEGETAKAYAAFCAYRDMGASRSVDKAFVHQNSAKTTPKIAPRHWMHWAAAHEWKRRAEAYDTWQEQEARATRENAQRETQEAYRTRVLAEAIKRADATNRMLDLTVARLESVNVDDIPATALPAFLRAAATAWRECVIVEGIALGLLDERGEPLQDGTF